MRRIKLFGSAAALLAGVCLVGTYAISQDKHTGHDHAKTGDKASDKAGAGAMDEAMMKAMMDAAKVGPHQRALEPMVGKFTYINKFRMDPAQEWVTSEGEYSGEMALGGRYLMSNVKGPMMGSEFQGMGCLGYDNTLGKHVAGWIDNMGTGVMRSEGSCTSDCKTITFAGEMMCPIEKTNKPYKYVYEIKSNDEFTMRWWSPAMGDGKMFESMVIDYKRVK